MQRDIGRRQFLQVVGVAGVGGVVAAHVLTGCAKESAAGGPPPDDFYFVQMSDTHWGFNDTHINPDFAVTLKKAIAGVNALPQKPDFIVFTGDLTHTTDDDTERRKRLREFKEITKELQVQDIHFLPGEHDAALDDGAAFKEAFGPTHYVFDHKGVHFIVLDNVSDPTGVLGNAQIQWLAADLQPHPKDTPVVVLTHRPLFDLAPEWEWATPDAAKAIALLSPYKNVTVFYGHIHQVNHHVGDNVTQHAAAGLMYPLPAPHSVPKKAPIPWDPAHPYAHLGYRETVAKVAGPAYDLTEFSVVAAPGVAAADDPPEQVIKITAKKFEYAPSEIRLKKGVPVTLEFISLDRHHGFKCDALNVRADIYPDKPTQLHLTPEQVGEFDFHCDAFCGGGHDRMRGKLIVTE